MIFYIRKGDVPFENLVDMLGLQEVLCPAWI